ncbi:monooxygenase [Pseudooceanicola sediminis]|uniref:Monooxygenase n=1 Tax=Pseudooceanicola sediminis TaxID=2211117 RepID=A0A399J5Z5_9RHOB|nr:FAD-dependent monooxygenase [Pseudooceanicola sediminis]KAA2316816.1 NAD(P)-binding protein [Puniceibacterium sp. HSS470]RII40821.1 monooxygenase [Pseudooceanicola sediminis]
MALRDLKIAVIGAGIGGLAAARALALRGADVTILEQAGAIREVGAGLQISPNGAAVLRGLGLDVAQIGQAGRALNLLDYRGRSALRMDLTPRDGAPGYYFCHRADVISALAESARQAGVRIRLLQCVDTVDVSDTPEIRTCTQTRIRPDLVVGADGLHSRLRAALLGEAQARFSGQVAWRAVVPVPANRPGPPSEARLFMGPGRHLVTYPLRGGRAQNIVAVEERREWAPDSWSHQDDPKALRRAFAGFCPEVKDLLGRVTTVNLWGLHSHPIAPEWHRDHCVLLGDAAHPTLPFLAQGANMALEDAWVLAAALDTADTVPDGLAQYQALRKARVTRAITAANRNAWKYHLRFAPLRAVAHSVLRLSDRVAPSFMKHQFDWLYDHDVTGGETLSEIDVRP